jgi:hypothetical protein
LTAPTHNKIIQETNRRSDLIYTWTSGLKIHQTVGANIPVFANIHTIPVFANIRTAVAFSRKPGCWKYALESTGFDPLVGSDGFDPLWYKSPNGPQML